MLRVSRSVLAIAAALAFASPHLASAYSSVVSLENVAFTDGGTVSGDLSIDTYGYIATSTVVTTPGSPETFTGASYGYPGAPSSPALFSGGTVILLTPSDATGYSLDIVVATGLSGGMAGTDAIVGGYEECVQFGGCAGGVAEFTQRLIALNTGAELVVPEPAALGLFGLGLTGLAAIRRRALAA